MRMLRRALPPLATAALLGLASLAAPAMLLAQEQPEGEYEDPAEERATAFRAVEGPQTEDVPGGALLIGAYALVWVLVLLYVLRLGSMQAGLAREVDRLERSLGAGEARGDGGKD